MALPTRTLAGVSVPDTPLITKSITYAYQHLDEHAFNHVMRSWLIGQLILSRLPEPYQKSFDVEAFAIATIFHDLGWSKTPELISLDKCFEVDGANAARAWLLKEADPSAWDKHRIQLVWDVIALHATPTIAAHKEPEVALASPAICTEILGIQPMKAMAGDLISVTQAEFDAIRKEFPRAGLKEYVKETLCGFCRAKPQTTYDSGVGGFGDKFVEGYSSEGRKMVDLMMQFIDE